MRFLSVRPEVCPWVSRFPTSGFLQIPPHDGHPCLRLYPSRYRADSGLSPVRNVRRQAHRSQLRDKLSRSWFWRCFTNRHIPFGRSCTFQAAESCDKYILAKKHDHSRISKRMENALKKQQFPRLWTSCVIIKEMEQRGGLA